jgi:hypothetical protein
MNDEMEMIYMEVDVAQSRYYPSIYLRNCGKPRKTSATITGAPSEIWTEVFPER